MVCLLGTNALVIVLLVLLQGLSVASANVYNTYWNDVNVPLTFTPEVCRACNVTCAGGWWTMCWPGAVTTATTQSKGPSITFTFQGQAIEFWGVPTPRGAQAVLALDGQTYSVDTQAAQYSSPLVQRLWMLGNLDESVEHTLVLSSGSAYDADNLHVHVNRFVVTTSDVFVSKVPGSSSSTTSNPDTSTQPPPPASSTQPPSATGTNTPSSTTLSSNPTSASTSTSTATPGVPTVTQNNNSTASPFHGEDAQNNSSSPSMSITPAALAGIVIGALILLALIVIAIILYRRRRHPLREELSAAKSYPHDAADIYDDIVPDQSTDILIPIRREKVPLPNPTSYPPRHPALSPLHHVPPTIPSSAPSSPTYNSQSYTSSGPSQSQSGRPSSRVVSMQSSGGLGLDVTSEDTNYRQVSIAPQSPPPQYSTLIPTPHATQALHGLA